MSVIIKKVSSSAELKKFIRFNYELYKENPFSVPDLYDDMLNTFSRDKNAAFEFCEADYFLAYKDGKLVGRVAAILNKRAISLEPSIAMAIGFCVTISVAASSE